MVPPNSINVVGFGGLGDILLTTPALHALREKYPRRRVIVYYFTRGKRDILLRNPDIDSLRAGLWYTNPWFAYLLRKNPDERIRRGLSFPHYAYLRPGMAYKIHVKEVIAKYFDVELNDKRLRVRLDEKESELARRTLTECGKAP